MVALSDVHSDAKTVLSTDIALELSMAATKAVLMAATMVGQWESWRAATSVALKVVCWAGLSVCVSV